MFAFCSGNIPTGFSALYRYAWIHSYNCKYFCASYGWGSCKLCPVYHKDYNILVITHLALILVFWLYSPFEQGDKARVIQTMLFMAAINTLLQTILGTRLPTVMTASFAFTLPVLSIINDYSDRTFRSEHEVCKAQNMLFKEDKSHFCIGIRGFGAIWL